MKFEYRKSFRRKGSVEVKACDDSDYIILVGDKQNEFLVNHRHGIPGSSFAPGVSLTLRLMLVLKYIWLYEHAGSWRVKRGFEDPTDAWAKGCSEKERRQIQVNLDHNSAVMKRLELDRNGILEEVWADARDIARGELGGMEKVDAALNELEVAVGAKPVALELGELDSASETN